MERFYAAVKAGAQEIYMGLKGFGARRNAENFTLEEYKEALDYAHKRGVRIFLTLNTIMMEKEMDFLYENLKVLYEHGLDAVIVQDLGYFRYMKENFPDMEYHGSTQMTVGNHIEAEYLRKIGFKRVVLPREMTFEEIKKIRENRKRNFFSRIKYAIVLSKEKRYADKKFLEIYKKFQPDIVIDFDSSLTKVIKKLKDSKNLVWIHSSIENWKKKKNKIKRFVKRLEYYNKIICICQEMEEDLLKLIII